MNSGSYIGSDQSGGTLKPEYKGLKPEKPPTFLGFSCLILVATLAPIFLALLILRSEPSAPASAPKIKLEVMRIPAPAATQNSTVIFLHGLGDTGAGWKALADAVQRTPGFSSTGFVLPTAPKRLITAYQQETTGWFDIMSAKVRCDRPGLLKSLKHVKDLVNEEVDRGIKPEKIILGGFSQGAALAQASAATLELKLGGFIAVSGFLPRPTDLSFTAVNVETPFLIQHGDADEVVEITRDQEGYRTLLDKGFNVEFKAYMGVEHTLSHQGLQDLMVFLHQALGEN